MRLKATKELASALQSDVDRDITGIPVISQSDVISVEVGKNGATWGIEEIVIDFGYWSNMQFRLWAINTLREVALNGGYISPEATSTQVAAINLTKSRMLLKPNDC